MTDLLRHRFSLSRRRLFQFAGAAGAAGFALTLDERPALAQPIFADYPFQLGVAAGDPAPNGFVIWTRLAPRPLEPGQGMPSQAVEVEWEVGTDAGFKDAIKGKALARPELGHSVHVEVAGLLPGRPYFYRFKAGKETSAIGRAKTLPAAGAPVAKARFGVAGCQHYEQGTYIAHRKLAGEDLDFVFFYGDYIYEYREQRLRNAAGGPFENPRRHIGGEIYGLDDYRRRYAQYRMDADLQASHAAAAWFVVWDDHEVDNNWTGDLDADGTPPAIFNLRRQAAAQAFYEFMPLRLASLPVGPSIQLYRRAAFGDLMGLQFLDTRQYRSDQPCNDKWGGVCNELDRDNAEVLGLRQEKWLYEGLSASKAKWNVLAQQVMVMDLDRDPGPDYSANPDTWGGYRTPRARLLKAIRDRRVANPIILTGDEHQNYAGEVFFDSRNPEGSPVAAEFVTTSISSSGDGVDQRPDTAKVQAANPALKFNNSQRGYSICEVTPERWVTEFKVMDRVSDRTGTLSTRAKVTVEAGSSKVEVG